MSLDLLAYQSAFGSWIADAREFAARVRFANPEWLWLTLLPCVLAVLARLTSRQLRRRLAAVGRLGAMAALQTRPTQSHPFAGFVMVLSWLLLTLAVARPQWGQSEEQGIAIGRDLVIVLDFSRSMWAEDIHSRTNPARWQSAIAITRELIDDLRNRGGHRVAVVLFASRAMLLLPLTTDFDHISFKLGELDATIPPAEIRPADDAAASGTRIGIAIEAAVAAHDPRFPGFQDILLLTDGDDPAEDREWRNGITVARNTNIPVHVVGLGDPKAESFVLLRDKQLEFIGPNGVRFPVQTRLHEEVTQALAEETRGAYLPVRQDPSSLAEFHRSTIESNATRDVGDERLPQPKERYHWFIASSGILLLLVWWRER